MSTTSLRDVAATTTSVHSTGVGELDRVVGGGFIAGSTTLLFGEPGVGKSTLALMSLRELAADATPVLLIAAEESVAQVAQRARRLGDVPAGLDVAASTDVDVAERLLRERRPTLCVVDSISAMSDDALGSTAGSVPQVRHVAERLCSVAKETGVADRRSRHEGRRTRRTARSRAPRRHGDQNRRGPPRIAATPSSAQAPLRSDRRSRTVGDGA
jgi:DNA repair protein RadA/Sms